MPELINVLFIGDIVGEPGMKAVRTYLETFIKRYEADFIIVNGENICDGKGLTEKEANELFDFGVNVITTGNHIWDNWKSKPLLSNNEYVLRPYNYPPGNVGRGFTFVQLKEGITVCVLQLQGRTYMQMIDCPFRAADSALKKISELTKNIIVDFHAETTAEKIAMGWHLNGKVSAIIGTHTHIQTSDARILPKGTAYISDSGMTGPYDSVVGLRKDIALKRLLLQTAHKFEMAENDIKIAGVFFSIDKNTCMSTKIESFCFPDFRKEAN